MSITNAIKEEIKLLRDEFLPPRDYIDDVCKKIESHQTINRWEVHNKVSVILARLWIRGSYHPDHEKMLWSLHESAKESL